MRLHAVNKLGLYTLCVFTDVSRASGGGGGVAALISCNQLDGDYGITPN